MSRSISIGRHHVGLPAAVVGEQPEAFVAVLAVDRVGGGLRLCSEVAGDRTALAAPLGHLLVGRVDLCLALGAIDRPLELATEHDLMPVATLLGIDLRGDVAPVDDDQLACRRGRAGPSRHPPGQRDCDSVLDGRGERLKPDVAVLELQTESFGRGATHRLRSSGLLVCEINTTRR